MDEYESLLHPGGGQIALSEILAKVQALESRNNGFALQGGSAVTYDVNGRIATLVATTITGQIVNAQIANVDFAKITNVSITNAQIASIDAGKITSGSVATARMESNVIAAIQAQITTLSAITANIGTITAGSITGVTITGGTVRTASSGRRILMDGTNNDLMFYGSSALYGKIFEDGGALALMGGASGTEGLIELYSDALWVYNNIVVNGWGSFAGDIDMNSNDINEIAYLQFVTSSNSTTSGRMWFYDGGSGNYFLRMRMGTWNGQVDMTGF